MHISGTERFNAHELFHETAVNDAEMFLSRRRCTAVNALLVLKETSGRFVNFPI